VIATYQVPNASYPDTVKYLAALVNKLALTSHGSGKLT
jgi:hypothetical protein